MIFLSIRSSLSGLFFSLLASTINEIKSNKKKFLENEMKDRINNLNDKCLIELV